MPSLYAPVHGAVGLAWVVRPWTRARLEAVRTPMKTIKSTQAVAAILARFQRGRNCRVPVTATDVYADSIARVCPGHRQNRAVRHLDEASEEGRDALCSPQTDPWPEQAPITWPLRCE